MAALLFLVLAFWLGDRIRRRAVPDTRALFAAIAGTGPARPADGTGDDADAPPLLPPSWTFDLPAALVTGVLVLASATYLAGYAFDALVQEGLHPLLPANALVLGLAAAAIAIDVLVASRPRRRALRADAASRLSGLAARVRAWAAARPFRISGAFRRPSVYAVSAAVFLALGWFLMASVLTVKDGRLSAGATVFSDYAPHIALIRSFSHGRNFPTEYPLFPGDGIRYHFLFLFLTGNLEFLGMRLDVAFNLLGALGLVAFCLLLGALAVLLVRRRSAFLVAPLLLFLRSSLAFATFLGALWRESDGNLGGVIVGLLLNRGYIGETPYENWGLWTVNVYSNQRHLLWGASVLVLALLLLLPLWRRSPQPRLLSRDAWLPQDARPVLLAGLLLVLLPYFHGSMLIGAFLVLGTVGLFSAGRLAFAAVLAAGAGSAVLQAAFFSGGAASVAHPRILLGFVAEDRTLAGVLAYCVLAFGVAFVLLPFLPLLGTRRQAVLWLAFLVPFVFAFTVSLTPDVAVNHKYILLAFALENVFLAGLLAALARPPSDAGRLRRILRKSLAVALAVFLTATGCIDLWTYFVANRIRVSIPLDSPVAAWIETHTDPDDVFLTPRYHYNAFFLAGRKAFLGWPYYAWSAGHGTGARNDRVLWLYAGAGNSADAFRAFCRENGIAYAIVDDGWRRDLGEGLDEAFLAANFRVAATFPDDGNLTVYAIG